MLKQLIKDMDEIEDISIRFGDRQDIYADRVIYAFSVVLLHILRYLVRQERSK